MTRKRINVDTAIAQILSEEEEDIDGSDYGNESDFETEDDAESSGNDDNICDDNNLQQQQPVSSGSVRSSPCAYNNYNVFTDRFYTSVQLAEYLLNHGIGFCGTAMTNRKIFPKCLKKTNKQMRKGESEMLFNCKVAAFVWMDKKPIYFVTSIYVDDPITSVSRYDATQHKKIPIQCPMAVKYYNQFMGGTDKNDQMTRLQKCRRHYKWPRRLVMKFLCGRHIMPMF